MNYIIGNSIAFRCSWSLDIGNKYATAFSVGVRWNSSNFLDKSSDVMGFIKVIDQWQQLQINILQISKDIMTYRIHSWINNFTFLFISHFSYALYGAVRVKRKVNKKRFCAVISFPEEKRLFRVVKLRNYNWKINKDVSESCKNNVEIRNTLYILIKYKYLWHIYWFNCATIVLL